MSSLSWQIRDLASELLVRYFPATFPKPIALALFQLAQDTLASPRVQEAEAGAVLMKTILQKYELLASPSLSLRWHRTLQECVGSTGASPVCGHRWGLQ